ncbi:SMP-30/gluconolactonase/LRE family protein [Aureimonas sp. AU40]|uniref:SMP-30/gluconolactonase/LRE family protein n=1 Tax=Aureimonas sp. AU40 TaxID=1637747 RepID=UPI0007834A39|nr:SMP-30/gluconolactonase/LRE family protein [Aureimonas sp. AU40]
MLYERFDPRFDEVALINVSLEQIHTGCRWTEGPVWFGDGNYLLWSDIPNDRMMRWIPEVGTHVYRASAGYTNGHTRDGAGRLVSCEHGARRVTRTEADGSLTVLATSFDGKRLNSPNDVVVHRDGSIWFTDPNYGIRDDYEGHKGTQEQDCQGVYRIDPATSAITRVASDFRQPNGLCFSPDHSLLYIADSGASHDAQAPRHIRRFKVEGETLTGGEVFALIDKGVPDGMRMDRDGRLWSSAADGIHVFHPDGTRLGKILVPETVANLCFGGPKGNRLFIAATTSIYSIYTRVRGA